MEQNRLWLNRNYSDILCRLAIDSMLEIEDIDLRITYLSKRYGEIILPEYDSDKTLIYSDQFGLIVKT